MPLLSGPPPTFDTNEQSCRKCNKEFNVLFARSRRCNHCGYLYCQSCTDYQALMPRSGSGAGYDPVPVCAYCIENLNITAGSKAYLRNQPMSRLRKYADAYNIDTKGILEKDEFIDTLIKARQQNGCLPPQNENYYRMHSVPNQATDRPRGIFSRAMDAINPDRPSTAPPPQPRQRTTSHPSSFARPDLNQTRSQQTQPQPQYRPVPPYGPQPPQGHWQYPPYAARNTPPVPPQRPVPPTRPAPNLNVPSTNTGSRPRSASAGPRSAPRQTSPPRDVPIPSLDELLNMSHAEIKALSIGALKQILFRNHVNARLAVEKSELVSKVLALIEDEKRERADAARRAEEEVRETREMVERLRRMREEQQKKAAAARQQQGQTQEQGETQQQPSGTTTTEEGAQTNTSSTEQQAASTPQGDQQEGQEQPMEGVESTPPPEQSQQQTGEDRPRTPTGDEHKPPEVPPKAPASPTPRGTMSAQAQQMASHLERTGLCVICQDEEANIAVVDCGHLAMCRNCSDLIMKTTKECPLCRTRIVTEARLLRIFRA
ncbi:hypothetical protein K474DRAFT_1693911 [Panus rudis PR-1116 ss-1]|nr:hypothetical protein K474DRAFT_1693911 [Panus rudis PR-1116 ss-1]